MNDRQPLVTIVTSTYNHAQYLRQSIDSVLSQTYPNIEYLVFNDGSQDDTDKILQSYGSRFFWETQPNMGEIPTLNKAYRMAKGEYLGKISSDDFLYPHAVEKLVASLLQQPDAVVAYADYDLVDENGEIFDSVKRPGYNFIQAVREHLCLPGSGHLFKRSLFDELSGLDPQFRIVSDMDFWWRAGLTGDFRHVAEPLSAFRVHRSSQSTVGGKRMAGETIAMVKKFYNLPHLPEEVRRVKRQAFGSAYFAASQQAFAAGDTWIARRYVLKSILTAPVFFVRFQGRYKLNKLLRTMGLTRG